MKNADTSLYGPEARLPKESHLQPLNQEADEIKRVIGAIIVSTRSGWVATRFFNFAF